MLPESTAAPAILLKNVDKTFYSVRARRRGLTERIVGFRKRSQKDAKSSVLHLRDINIRVEPGESVALIGNNGSGKSSLLRVIAGIYQPSHGVVSVRGRLSPVLQLGAGFNPNLSGLQNIYINSAILGMSRRQVESLVPAITDFAELSEDIGKPVKHYSTGMQARLAFSVAVSVLPDVLLLDEILAVGDNDFQKKCLRRIQEIQASGTTIMYVSHDLQSVASLCPRTIWLSQGSIVADGDTEQVIRDYCQA